MNKVILKVSGEALKNGDNLVSKDKLEKVLDAVKSLQKEGFKVSIVVGGGNIFRGREHTDMDKVIGDTIGMMGTIINALYIKDYLNSNNINSIVSTPFSFPGLIQKYTDKDLKNLYEDNTVIVFGGGVGCSGYSTDSGLVYASEKIDANLFVKITNVDGVYDSDPRINKNAKKYDNLTFDEVIDNDLKVMDIEAIHYAKENNIKILVINFNDSDKINDLLRGRNIGTIIGG